MCFSASYCSVDNQKNPCYNSGINVIHEEVIIIFADIFVYENRKHEIGQRIAALRKTEKLTQEELADRLLGAMSTKEKPIKQSTISSWEKGVTLPPLERLLALAAVFNCDVAYLLGDYSEKKKDTQDICNMTGLSEAAVNQLLQYKKNYPDYVDSLNFLLESGNFEDALYHMYEYVNALQYLDVLRQKRRQDIESLSSIQDYTPNLTELDRIRVAQEKADLCEYNLFMRFTFIIQEIKRKTEDHTNHGRKE